MFLECLLAPTVIATGEEDGKIRRQEDSTREGRVMGKKSLWICKKARIFIGAAKMNQI